MTTIQGAVGRSISGVDYADEITVECQDSHFEPAAQVYIKTDGSWAGSPDQARELIAALVLAIEKTEKANSCRQADDEQHARWFLGDDQHLSTCQTCQRLSGCVALQLADAMDIDGTQSGRAA